MDAAFGSFLLFEQVDGDMAQDGQVFGSLILADPTVVFVQATSKTQCRLFSIDQCLRTAWRISSAWLVKLEM